MTIKEELIDYANRCLAGEEISGKKHKWACMRFLRDCKKEDAKNVQANVWPYHWDEEEASKIVDWFSMLRHSKGDLAGQPISLTIWQKFNLCQLYGWREDLTGYKRFKQSFIEVGRKNAKSQMEAGVALYEISVMATRNEENYEYYTAGTKRDQSKIILNEAKLMLNKSPLKPLFKITRDAVIHRKTGSFIKALSKEDGQNGDGTNPAGLILDEYHQHKTTEFEPTENAETKGDTTNFQTATIEGKAYPVEVDGKMSIGKKLVFDSEAKAKAWLNKQATITA